MTKTFRDLGVHPALCDALDARGITHPFAIQELTLPLALDGNDLIGQARTGTGKTLAFGLPLLQRIDPKLKKTQALVIAPTRELAIQVHEDLSIGSAIGLTSVSVYGGVGYDEQIDALTGGAHVVVGTPGRLLDHLNRGNLDLSSVTQLVLDEADEMLDMGFLPDVERLIESCQGEDRHTMLFSATMPTAIVKLARRYMDHPTFTRADHEQKNTAPLVTQHFFQVHRMDKPRILARILQSPGRGGVYVFVRTKHMADRLVDELEQLGTPAIPIHGDLRQTAREKNLDKFRSGKATVLVATEVAARGLDVTGVTHVVNYDCPDDEKMYLHRIGRTARAGEAGVAVTFAEFNEADRLNVIRKAVGATETAVMQVFSTSPELTEMFDLPDEKPWDAMVKSQTNDGGRSRAAARSASENTGTSDRRGSRSDGRPKNSRRTEGQGSGHDADRGGRDRGGRSGGTDTKTAPDAGGRKDDARKSNDRKSDERKSNDRSSSSNRGSSDKGGRDNAGRDNGGRDNAGRDNGGRDNEGRDSARKGDAGRAKSESTDGAGRSRARARSGDDDQRGDASSDTASAGGERVRTRTRSRTRDSASSTRSRESGGDAGKRETSERSSTRDTNGGRSRSGERSKDGGGNSGSREGGRTRASSGRDRSDQQSRSSGRRSGGGGGGNNGGSSSESDSNSGSGSKGGGSRKRASGGRRRSGDDSEGGDRGGRSSGRDSGGGSGRDGGGNTSGRQKSGKQSRSSGGGRQRSDREPGVSLSSRGPEARGEGQPQLARRVKVEKLP